MTVRHPTRAALLAMLALLLSGCAQLEPLFEPLRGKREPARPHPRVEEKSDKVRPRAERSEKAEKPIRPERASSDRDEIALREGIALYHDGEYNAAIKRLNSNDMNGASLRNRLSALKYTAFSYCLSGRQAQCRQSFDRAFKLDASFDLGPGEHGHPLWGPVFAKAKQAAGR